MENMSFEEYIKAKEISMNEWKVYKNPGMEPTPYHIARQIREDEPLHGGNIEESEHGYFASKEAAQIVANEINREEQSK